MAPTDNSEASPAARDSLIPGINPSNKNDSLDFSLDPTTTTTPSSATGNEREFAETSMGVLKDILGVSSLSGDTNQTFTDWSASTTAPTAVSALSTTIFPQFLRTFNSDDWNVSSSTPSFGGWNASSVTSSLEDSSVSFVNSSSAPASDDEPSARHPYYTYYLTCHYIFSYVLNPVAAFGILGNALTFYVLYRRRAKTPPIIIMMALAVFDTILLVILILEYGLAYVSMFNKTGLTGYMPIWSVMRPYLFTSSNIAQTVIVWLTLFLSVERFTAICRPLKFMANCTHQRAIKSISLIVIFSIALNIVKFFEMKNTVRTVSKETGETSCYTNPGCVNSALRINQIYWFLYYVVVLPLLVYIGPFLIILILNVQVVRAHKESLLWRKQHFHVQQEVGYGTRGEQHSVTLICVAVVVMFLLCTLPENVLHILMLFDDERLPGPPLVPIDRVKLSIFKVYCILLININSSVNFLLYSWFSSSFRLMVKDILFGRCLRLRTRRLASSCAHLGSRFATSTTAAFRRPSLEPGHPENRTPGSQGGGGAGRGGGASNGAGLTPKGIQGGANSRSRKTSGAVLNGAVFENPANGGATAAVAALSGDGNGAADNNDNNNGVVYGKNASAVTTLSVRKISDSVLRLAYSSPPSRNSPDNEDASFSDAGRKGSGVGSGSGVGVVGSNGRFGTSRSVSMESGTTGDTSVKGSQSSRKVSAASRKISVVTLSDFNSAVMTEYVIVDAYADAEVEAEAEAEAGLGHAGAETEAKAEVGLGVRMLGSEETLGTKRNVNEEQERSSPVELESRKGQMQEDSPLRASSSRSSSSQKLKESDLREIRLKTNEIGNCQRMSYRDGSNREVLWL